MIKKIGKSFLKKYDEHPLTSLFLGVILLFSAFFVNILLFAGALSTKMIIFFLIASLSLAPTMIVFFFVIPLMFEFLIEQVVGYQPILGGKKGRYRSALGNFVNFDCKTGRE